MKERCSEGQDDQGVGLIELLVVMSLLTLALALFGTVFTVASRASDRSRDLGAATDQVRVALAELDRQVRFGYWLKPTTVPGLSCPSGTPTCAVKLLTVSGASGRRCWAWALDPATSSLRSFNWAPTGVSITLPSISSWHVVAGPESEAYDEVRLTGRLGVDPLSEGFALRNSDLSTVSYYKTLMGQVTVTKGGRAFSSTLAVSTRNQLAGGDLATIC